MAYGGIIRRGALALATAAGIAMVPAVPAFAVAPSHQGWVAQEDDQLLFDVRVKQWRIGNGVRGYQTDKGVCVDLADMVMALDLPVRIDKKSRRATGWLFEESRTITINRENDAVQIMNTSQKLAPGDIYDTPEGWCVNSRILAQWLNFELKVDMSNALLLISADRKLPFELVEERKKRAAQMRPTRSFDLRSLPQAHEPYRMWRTPSVDVVASFGAISDQGRGKRAEARYEIYASGEIAKASVDARLSSDNKGVPENLRVRAYRTDPEGGLLGPLRATHVALGDISAPDTPLAAASTAGRGFLITNRPIERPLQFDRTSFRGELPNGWDAELYRNDELLGFVSSRADGRYEFLDVPLLYGQNRFEIVLYGPQGQERREVQMVPVGLDSIPPRKTYYWATFQDRGRDLIHLGDYGDWEQTGWRTGMGLERGLDTRTAIAASFYALRHRDRRRTYAEAALRRAIGPALAEFSAGSDLKGGYALRGQMIGQWGRTYFTAETVNTMGSYSTEQLEDDVTSLHRFAIDHGVKIAGKTIPVHLDARYVGRNTGYNSMQLGARLSWNVRRLTMSAEMEWEKVTAGKGIRPQDRLEAGMKASGQIGPVRLRGEARFRLKPESRFQSASLTGQWRAGERSDWRAELGYDAPGNRARMAAGYVRRFDRLALTAQAEAASDGSVAGGLSLAFSFGPEPRTGALRFSADKLASSGQASVLVYRDENADGRRQADEPIERDVGVVAGMAAPVQTGANGVAMVGNLVPFRPVLVGVDAGTLSDPFVQPANSGIVMVPRPGVASPIELPLVAAGEVDGTLVRAGGGSLSGVAMELLDGKGRVVSMTRTEFDGFFLFEKIPYGRYGLRIAAASAAAIDSESALDTSVLVDKAHPVANLGAVMARPLRRVAVVAAQGP